MSVYILDLLVIGLLLLFVTLGSAWIERLPFSFALIYLIVGFCLGPYVLGLIKIRPSAEFLERACEFVVLVSVFGCGMKMNRPLKSWAWRTTARLIGFAMPLTIIAIAAACHWLLGWNWPESVLLGAILSPTDPVLASEVQLSHVEDKDELRFGLTSEGGLNDALAFPFVYFGIYWLEKGSLDKWFKEWVAIDVIWAIGAGIAMGVIVARAIVWLERKVTNRRPMDGVIEDFIALSTILLTYSLTEVVNGYGFLAVFVAGYTVQSFYYSDQERRHAQLEFIEQIEKLLEIGAILLIGSLLLLEPIAKYSTPALIIAALVLFVIRPASVWLSFMGSRLPKPMRWLLGWFGVRGIGSIYYLSYALGKGIEGEIAEQIVWITLSVIMLSVVIHGISATPLMNWYERQMEGLRKKEV
ncbi:sodium:proton antiporter [Oscillatoria sp. FACHB-1406]|uniref:cation:proton antiporter n=1 Tax=Oscillatoria sp. FACHB-1406 TaxID=2692846 RepID=UPI0016856D2C|nr:sodium:proton antiporter [Oscillatoria sp. FACHB-1406]MBD2579356.1 sodium:proton antiporter [Oscillatoria sp. FACHB-1406]